MAAGVACPDVRPATTGTVIRWTAVASSPGHPELAAPAAAMNGPDALVSADGIGAGPGAPDRDRCPVESDLRRPQTAFYAIHPPNHGTAPERQAATWELVSTLHAAFGARLPSGLFTEVIEGLPERVLVDKSLGADMLVLGSTSGPTLAGRPVGPVIRSCLSRARLEGDSAPDRSHTLV